VENLLFAFYFKDLAVFWVFGSFFLRNSRKPVCNKPFKGNPQEAVDKSENRCKNRIFTLSKVERKGTNKSIWKRIGVPGSAHLPFIPVN
jgi:hypothetical protein